MIVNAALFLAVALWINRLAFFLSPAALLVLSDTVLQNVFRML